MEGEGEGGDKEEVGKGKIEGSGDTLTSTEGGRAR